MATHLTVQSTSNNSGRDNIVLANLLEDKIDDMLEGYSRGMNGLLFDDGTTDSSAFAGIRSVILDDPSATGTTVGGCPLSRILGGATGQTLLSQQRLLATN